jgi:regulatory protein RepA
MSVHNLSYYATRKPTPEEGWLFKGLLKRQNIGFIIGEAKLTYKSWLLFDLGWSLARGEPPWGEIRFRPPHAGHTIYFAMEDSEDDIHDRYQVLKRAKGERPEDSKLTIVTKDAGILLAGATERESRDGLDRIRRIINKTGEKPDLMIFDVLAACHMIDENRSDEMMRLLNNVGILVAETGAAVLFAHHPRKPHPEFESDFASPHNARGSGALWGAADLFINAGREGKEKVKLDFKTKRARTPGPVTLKVDCETGVIERVEEDEEVGVLKVR